MITVKMNFKKLKGMEKNFCRICNKFFCCESCRSKHEISEHKIHPECDICLYGKTNLKTPSDSLLIHLRTSHWPLHCIKCKKQFLSTVELKIHKMCFKEDFNAVGESEYKSPLLNPLINKSILTSSNANYSLSVTTSTPMQNSNERDLEKIEEIITPVDFVDKNKPSDTHNNSGVTPNCSEQSKSTNVEPKRRVTFCETPYNEYSHFKKLKSSLSYVSIYKQKGHCSEDKFGIISRKVSYENPQAEGNSTSSVVNSMFLTATETTPKLSLAKIDEHEQSDETQWESALAQTPLITYQILSPSIQIISHPLTFSTPGFSNIAKKSFRMLSPTTPFSTPGLYNTGKKSIQTISPTTLFSTPGLSNNHIKSIKTIFPTTSFSTPGLSHTDVKSIQTLSPTTSFSMPGLSNTDIKSIETQSPPTPFLTPGLSITVLNSAQTRSPITPFCTLGLSNNEPQSIKTLSPTTPFCTPGLSNNEPQSIKIISPTTSFSTPEFSNTDTKNINYSEDTDAEITSLTEKSIEFNNTELSLEKEKQTGIWSSVTSVMRNVIRGMKRKSTSEYKSEEETTETEKMELVCSPVRKRMKLSLECRKTIHPIRNSFRRYKRRVECCDRSSQTD